jgi:hypothetical protein
MTSSSSQLFPEANSFFLSWSLSSSRFFPFFVLHLNGSLLH